MAAEVTGVGAEHPVLAALARLHEAVGTALGESAWSLSGAELGGALAAATSLVARVEAFRGGLLREAVSREVPDARGERGARTVDLLKARCRVSARRATADVANARLTCPGTGTLRELGAALAEGAVSREHVDVARSVMTRLPRRVARERRAEVDHLLTEHARRFDPSGADHLARHLLSVVAPDRADRYDEDAVDRRHLTVVTDQTGMVLLSGQLDQAGGLTVAAVLDHFVEKDRAARNDAQALPDVRTRGQRRADALVELARAAAEHDGLGTAARAVPRVVVVTTPDQLAGADGAGAATTTDGTLVDRGALTRIACDAVVDRVVLDPAGRVLAMDTLGRLATPAQQIALAARDRGCVRPGCTVPPSLCEAHHVVWWSRGGPTTIDNLALLCHRHHSLIHAQPEHDDAWVMVVRDGLPWFRPPGSLDPDRTLRRNTFHRTVQATRATGLRWRTPRTTSGPTDGDPDPPAT